VESLADWKAVRAARCDIAQGYYIARPMDEGLFVEFCMANLLAAPRDSFDVLPV
jgi:EAL domain-containing protein (putative c-di-GMP-specific phosphodiesterase class I)